MTRSYRTFTSLLDDFLKNPQFAADFLSESLAERDFATFLMSLKDVIRVHGSISSLAQKTHLSRGTLYNLFAERANPEIKTILAVLDSLGYSLKVTQKERIPARKKSRRKTRASTSRSSIKSQTTRKHSFTPPPFSSLIFARGCALS